MRTNAMVVLLPCFYHDSDLVAVNGLGIDWNSIDDGTYTLISTASTFDNIQNFVSGNAYDIAGGRSAYFQPISRTGACSW